MKLFLIDGMHRVRLSEDNFDGWCRNIFASLTDGGRWGVPRSGLTFQRRGHNSLVLIDRDSDFSPIDQQNDFEAIRERFKRVGINVIWAVP